MCHVRSAEPREARDSNLPFVLHKLVLDLGTGYSGTSIVTGALHMQLQMDDVISLIVDDIMILLYWMYGILIVTYVVHKNSKG